MCDQTTNTTSQIKSGKVKVYGVTSLKRVPSLPDIPTLDEQGLKGFEVGIWHALYGPKGMPKPVTDKLVAALQETVKDESVKKRFAELGATTYRPRRRRPRRCRRISRRKSTNGDRSSRKPGVTPTRRRREKTKKSTGGRDETMQGASSRRRNGWRPRRRRGVVARTEASTSVGSLGRSEMKDSCKDVTHQLRTSRQGLERSSAAISSTRSLAAELGYTDLGETKASGVQGGVAVNGKCFFQSLGTGRGGQHGAYAGAVALREARHLSREHRLQCERCGAGLRHQRQRERAPIPISRSASACRYRSCAISRRARRRSRDRGASTSMSRLPCCCCDIVVLCHSARAARLRRIDYLHAEADVKSVLVRSRCRWWRSPAPQRSHWSRCVP